MPIRIRRGFDLRIEGEPEQVVEAAPPVGTVAALGGDYLDLRPAMRVEEGDRVRLGQPLFNDRRREGITVTAPGAGVVKEIIRGDRRALQAVTIELDGDEQVTFRAWNSAALATLDRADVIENLVRSGLWCALRTRPWSKVPDPATGTHAIFVNAMDTNPLAPDPVVVIGQAAEDFSNGVTVLSRLTAGSTFVCKAEGAAIEVPTGLPTVQVAEFSGPHPAGLVGTHIHFLYPVSAERTVWHLGYQDAIAIGRLFTTGQLDPERVVSLAGPTVNRPRLLRTRLGAHVPTLVAGEFDPEVPARVISGSVWSGRSAHGELAFLGRYHQQVSVLPEGGDRQLLGWLNPAGEKVSATRAFLSSFSAPSRRFRLSTNRNGSPRAMVPIDSYENVMPLDILPVQLLRSILVGDTDDAQKLGVLELDEEDLALCTFVCPGKYEYGPVLRERLEQIEREG